MLCVSFEQPLLILKIMKGRNGNSQFFHCFIVEHRYKDRMTAETMTFLMENNVSKERIAGTTFSESSAKIPLYPKCRCISVIYIVVCKYSATLSVYLCQFSLKFLRKVFNFFFCFN